MAKGKAQEEGEKVPRREVWEAVQRERAQRPQCMRTMTRRILR
jgi:hypothetical protein